MSVNTSTSQSVLDRLQQFYRLTKPRVVSLIVFTAVIGMFLAVPCAVLVLTLISYITLLKYNSNYLCSK